MKFYICLIWKDFIKNVKFHENSFFSFPTKSTQTCYIAQICVMKKTKSHLPYYDNVP